jgi:hypothetical protein
MAGVNFDDLETCSISPRRGVCVASQNTIDAFQ